MFASSVIKELMVSVNVGGGDGGAEGKKGREGERERVHESVKEFCMSEL
jgi:hypothetical protein